MKNIHIVILLLTVLCFQSCFVGEDGDSEKIVGNYYISGDYGFKNVHLGFEDKEWGGIGLIEQPITAIGNNDNYIIVKRELVETEFFILKVIESGIHSVAEENVLGPLTEREFETKRHQLDLRDIKWAKNFEK
ncbi:hypothetical protein [Marivirga sp.]|uniref:hypothetical protein n=1 Tax=Marivirga sp. TaxID=2018662 RepID=UPI0025EAB134|nr:hypothetical protein [Marivirga sp.]